MKANKIINMEAPDKDTRYHNLESAITEISTLFESLLLIGTNDYRKDLEANNFHSIIIIEMILKRLNEFEKCNFENSF